MKDVTARPQAGQALVYEAPAGLHPLGFDPSRIDRRDSQPPHPADGLVARVSMGGGAQMCLPDPCAYQNGGIAWRLTYGDPLKIRYVAASVITSYASLLSDGISTKEAVARLRILRQAYQYCARTPRDSDTHPKDGDGAVAPLVSGAGATHIAPTSDHQPIKE